MHARKVDFIKYLSLHATLLAYAEVNKNDMWQRSLRGFIIIDI